MLSRMNSRGSDDLLELAQELVSVARSPEHLEQLAYTIWPRLRILSNRDCKRLLVDGDSDGDLIYVDLTQ